MVRFQGRYSLLALYSNNTAIVGGRVNFNPAITYYITNKRQNIRKVGNV